MIYFLQYIIMVFAGFFSQNLTSLGGTSRIVQGSPSPTFSGSVVWNTILSQGGGNNSAYLSSYTSITNTSQLTLTMDYIAFYDITDTGNPIVNYDPSNLTSINDRSNNGGLLINTSNQNNPNGTSDSSHDWFNWSKYGFQVSTDSAPNSGDYVRFEFTFNGTFRGVSFDLASNNTASFLASHPGAIDQRPTGVRVFGQNSDGTYTQLVNSSQTPPYGYNSFSISSTTTHSKFAVELELEEATLQNVTVIDGFIFYLNA